MRRGLLHIYRNIPYGRETLLSSIYFSKMVDTELNIYIPKFKKFNMYFEHKAVQVTLDGSYLASPETAEKNLKSILSEQNVQATILNTNEFSASSLPDVPTDFSYMTCPRSISGLLNKIYPGQIGPVVRDIILNSTFPVYLPSIIFKPWESIVIMFNGTEASIKGAELGFSLFEKTKLPLYIFTQAEEYDKNWYEKKLTSFEAGKKIIESTNEWFFFDSGDFEINLFCIPHNALIVAGIFKHSLLKGITFGSKLEIIQSTLPNNFLFVGPYFISDY